MVSFIKKYILPKEIDFFDLLYKHSLIINQMSKNLNCCFLQEEQICCQKVMGDVELSKKMRKDNIKKLFSTFITPIDRESIYRVINELDWIAISINHFLIETQTYKINNLKEYQLLLNTLVEMSENILNSLKALKVKNNNEIIELCESIRVQYNQAVNFYIEYMYELSKNQNFNIVFLDKELLFQLRDIAKRFRVCSNYIEDIVAKMV
jgi:uncharacterized protein Yka (UPF0111/DUF47 family)